MYPRPSFSGTRLRYRSLGGGRERKDKYLSKESRVGASVNAGCGETKKISGKNSENILKPTQTASFAQTRKETCW